jgi:hypothetical protein
VRPARAAAARAAGGVDHRRRVVGERFERAGAQRVHVDAVDALGEVDVTPVGLDRPEELAGADVRVLRDSRRDVPVRELVAVPLAHRNRVGAAVDRARRNGVHRRPVRRGDVDSEVERMRRAVDALVLARVVERAADRMRPVEGLQRPPVRAHGGRSGQRHNACRERCAESPHDVRHTVASRP